MLMNSFFCPQRRKKFAGPMRPKGQQSSGSYGANSATFAAATNQHGNKDNHHHLHNNNNTNPSAAYVCDSELQWLCAPSFNLCSSSVDASSHER